MTAYDHSSGYTYGTDAVPTSPLTLEDLRQIEAAAHVQPGDAELLARAEPILAPHAMDMVDTWRGILAQKTYLAAHSAHPDGQPNPEYAQASKPRFAQWIIDMCTRERDQAWLDYQYLIGARHMSAAKNAADGADSTPFVPLRYVLAFIAPTVEVGHRLLAEGFKGEELNPLEFLTMLYGNIQAMRQAGGHETDYLSGLEMELKTDYERDKREIEELMLHFLPHYMEDLRHGAYTLPRNTEQSLRHIFTVGAMKEYFYENMPSMANPLGLGHKAMPLACKVQNLLIADFLHYLALRHDVYLSTASSDIKKNSMTKP